MLVIKKCRHTTLYCNCCSHCAITDDVLTSKVKDIQCGDWKLESGVMSPDVQIHVIAEIIETKSGKVGCSLISIFVQYYISLHNTM